MGADLFLCLLFPTLGLILGVVRLIRRHPLALPTLYYAGAFLVVHLFLTCGILPTR